MRKNLTEIVFIIDKSGSMAGLVQDTIGGFNSLVAKQQNEDGDAIVSTILFDTESRVIHDRVDIGRVPVLTEKIYTPSGCTALLDAVGSAIHHIGNVHKYAREEDRPEKTIVIITTDGMENSSKRYELPQVKRMIERQKNEYGWEFIFLGANIDAADTAQKMGIPRETAVDYMADCQGTQIMYESVGCAISCARSENKLSSEWRRKIDGDYAERSNKRKVVEKKPEYPECKRYPELFERMKHNQSSYDPPDRFYVTNYGLIAYHDGAYWLTRNTDGTWEKNYHLSDDIMDMNDDVAWIEYDVVKEYGFTEPVEGVDYEGLPDYIKERYNL